MHNIIGYQGDLQEVPIELYINIIVMLGDQPYKPHYCPMLQHGETMAGHQAGASINPVL